MKKEVQKKDIAKAYGKYIKKFTPKPNLLKNCLRAFFSGGALCAIASFCNNLLINSGIEKEDAGTIVTLGIVIVAQLLTGLGVFDTIAKYAGAGVIVPISGFANSMVAPAIEYKKEGPVLGAGAKMFIVAGPVLVCGIVASTIVGLIYWLIALY